MGLCYFGTCLWSPVRCLLTSLLARHFDTKDIGQGDWVNNERLLENNVEQFCNVGD